MAFNSDKLCVNGKYLAVFVLGGFATINEVFEHGQSIANDITNCEHKMKRMSARRVGKAALTELRGTSAQERLLHRLHSVALVLERDFSQ